jgi:hypothetical protein
MRPTTRRELAKRFNTTIDAIRHRVRTRQIKPKYTVIKGRAHYLISDRDMKKLEKWYGKNKRPGKPGPKTTGLKL